MPTQPCFKDFVVPKDAIHRMCPSNDNNIPVKQEENKQQESHQWVLMYCKGGFICRRYFYGMPPVSLKLSNGGWIVLAGAMKDVEIMV